MMSAYYIENSQIASAFENTFDFFFESPILLSVSLLRLYRTHMQSYAQNIFLGIPIEWYSRILGVGVLIILACVIIHIIGYIFSRTIRVHTHNIAYFTYLKIIGIFALLSTIFAMIYQL